MTKQKRSRQTWWPLYVLALIMVGLLFLAHQFAPSPGWRTFLEIGVVVVGYGLIAWWLETHPTMLLDQPAAEADNPTVKWSQLETSAPPSPSLRYRFYTGSDPAFIYREPEQSPDNPCLNGYHPLPEPLSPDQERQSYNLRIVNVY